MTYTSPYGHINILIDLFTGFLRQLFQTFLTCDPPVIPHQLDLTYYLSIGRTVFIKYGFPVLHEKVNGQYCAKVSRHPSHLYIFSRIIGKRCSNLLKWKLNWKFKWI